MGNDFIEIACLEVVQPIGRFYVGVINSGDLERISFADIRALDRTLDDYLGIQRVVSPKRVEDLRRYVNTVDATFPTSIILAISSENADYDPVKKIMKIRNTDEVAKIIDGQHRIKGLKDYSAKNFQLNVSIFIDMEVEDQAMVFATINIAQTKVNKSLVYDLYEYTKTRSPQKTGHNIARLLGSKKDSPFYNRIKILGTAGKMQTLTQATFVEALIKLISGTPERALQDRDEIKRKKKLDNASIEEEKILVFRNMFIAKQDAQIADVVWNYFSAVKQKWPSAWANVEQQGNILPRTNGFKALMRLFPLAYNKIGMPGSTPEQEEFYQKIFYKITLEDADMTIEKYKPGTSGESEFFNHLASGADLL